MAVTEIYTNAEICTDALRKLGVVAIDEPASGYDIEVARRGLERMLKGWQNAGYNLWTVASQSVAVTTGAEHTLDPVRPVSIESVRFKVGGIETPMSQMTRSEYDRQPQKLAKGRPTSWYYDRQREAARLYVWPVLATTNGETLEITYTREIADVVLTEAADVPGEWYEAVVYCLADRLSEDYDVNKPKLTQRAELLLNDALAWDREGSVYFAGDWAE